MPTTIRHVLLGASWSAAIALAVLSTFQEGPVRGTVLPWILIFLTTALVASIDCVVWRHRCELLEDLDERYREAVTRIH